MTAAAIILFIIFFFASWILFMPLVIDVDTERTVYQVSQTGTFRFWLERDFQPRLHVMGIAVPLQQQRKQKTEISSPKKRRSKISLHASWVLIRKIFRSICIKRFQVDIDTDDVVMNAQLIPALVFLSRGQVQLSANFEGRVYASLLAEVRLYRLAWAFLEFFTKK